MITKVKSLLEAKFKTGWGNTSAISWDNYSIDKGDSWVRFNMSPMLPIFKSIGEHKLERYAGVVIVQCFARCDTGMFAVTKLLDKVAEIYRNQELQGDGVRVCVDDFVVVLNAGVDGDYQQANIQVRYRAEKIF